MSPDSDTQNQNHSYSGDDSHASSSSSSSSPSTLPLVSPPPKASLKDLLIDVPDGVMVHPTTSDVRDGWFTTSAKISDAGALATPTIDYRGLSKRIHDVKNDTWRALGLRDMIVLSTFVTLQHLDMLLPLLDFWSSNINAFIFPWGILTLTVLDVSAITGLPASSKTVHPSKLPKEAGRVRIPTRGSFSKFLLDNIQTDPKISDDENIAFLLYFFCKFFYGTNSAVIVQDLQLFSAMMASGKAFA